MSSTDHNKKKSNQGFPDYVIKRKRLNHRKTVIIVDRNNLSYKDFVFNDGKYKYHENFEYKTLTGTIEITINCADFSRIFTVNSNSTKVCGSKHHFGIKLKFPDQKYMPIIKEVQRGCLQIKIKCYGDKLYYDKGNITTHYGKVIPRLNMTATKPVIIPSSVVWSYMHPYQGGGVSSR